MKKYYILALIFLLVFSFRLYFEFQPENFNYDSYDTLRQINHIKDTGLPLIKDSLSFGGKTNIFSPIHPYILAIINIPLPDTIVFKLLPNLIASSIIIITYLISKKITNSENIALTASFISAFIPIYLSETINSISIYSLVIPLMFFTLYLLMDSKKTNSAIICILLLSILHPSSLIFAASIIIYMLLAKLEHIKLERSETELFLFSIFLTVFTQLIIYRQALLAHGPLVIWQNIPSQILSSYFTPLSILEAIITIGVIPFSAGIYTIYNYLLKRKDKSLYLLISFAMSSLILLWLKLIDPEAGYIILGITMAILSAKTLKDANIYLKKTLFSDYKKHLLLVMLIVFILSSITASFYITMESISDSPDNAEIDALLWLRENSEENSTILATPEQGHLITAVAERKNIVDSNFLLTENPSQRLEDIERMFKTPYKIEAIDLLNKYSTDYIFFSEKAKQEYNIDRLRYIDGECFEKVYEDNILIYQSLCKVEELR
ncbi:hypothetical protein GF336_06955 [Candidatus Woesearchaeota archaeon]|nr:hypothetical protein [Candidatus Woesearchaeota archaeon]